MVTPLFLEGKEGWKEERKKQRDKDGRKGEGKEEISVYLCICMTEDSNP